MQDSASRSRQAIYYAGKAYEARDHLKGARYEGYTKVIGRVSRTPLEEVEDRYEENGQPAEEPSFVGKVQGAVAAFSIDILGLHRSYGAERP